MGGSLGHQRVASRLMFPETKVCVLLQDLAQPVKLVKPMEEVGGFSAGFFPAAAGQRWVFSCVSHIRNTAVPAGKGVPAHSRPIHGTLNPTTSASTLRGYPDDKGHAILKKTAFAPWMGIL